MRRKNRLGTIDARAMDAETLRDELSHHQAIEHGGFQEETGVVDVGGKPCLFVLARPTGRSHATGVVISHSYFEISMLQGAEVELARSIARSGRAAIYVQSPGMGDSAGDPAACLVEDRVAAALVAFEEMKSRVPEMQRPCFFGARLGGLVALLGAQEMGASAVAVWDPALDGDAYWTQVRRLARVAAVVGRQDLFQEPAQEVSKDGRSSVLGVEVTPAQLEDMKRAPERLRHDSIEGPGLLLALNDSAVSRLKPAVAASVTGPLETASLGQRDFWHLGLRRGHAATVPTIAWMSERLD